MHPFSTILIVSYRESFVPVARPRDEVLWSLLSVEPFRGIHMYQAAEHEVVNAAEVEASLSTIKKQNSVCTLREMLTTLTDTDRRPRSCPSQSEVSHV